jgi:hypothetical protein
VTSMPPRRRCGAMEVNERLAERYASFRANQDRIERFTERSGPPIRCPFRGSRTHPRRLNARSTTPLNGWEPFVTRLRTRVSRWFRPTTGSSPQPPNVATQGGTI